MSCCSLLIFSSEFDLWLFLYSFLTLHLHQAFMAVDGIGTVVSVLSGRVRIILASVFFLLLRSARTFFRVFDPVCNNFPSSGPPSTWMSLSLSPCKWSSGRAGLLQMVVRMGWSFANDLPDGLALCKCSFGWAGLLQMIIQMGLPFANDHLDFFLSTKFFSIFLFIFSKFPFSSKKHHLLLQNTSSSSNLT